MTRIFRLARRPIVAVPLVVVVALGGWAIYRANADKTATASSATRIVAVTVGPMPKVVSAQGNVAPAQSDDLHFTAAGTVTAVNVKAGQKVTAGTVLATSDSPALRKAVGDAEANLASAQATLSDDASSGASASRLAADRSSVTTATDQLNAAKASLAGATLVAPYDAQITAVGVSVGDQLGDGGAGATSPTGSQSGSGRTAYDLGGNPNPAGVAVSLVSLGTFTVRLGFDATDIKNIAVGQSAVVVLTTAVPSFNRLRASDGPDAFRFSGPTPKALVGRSATGAVDTVAAIADASSGVTSYPVRIRFTDSTGAFNAGANVKVEVQIGTIDNAVQVPAVAVHTVGTKSTVTVRHDGKNTTRTVKTGTTSGSTVQITSGLSKGERVVVAVPSASSRATKR